MAPITSNNPPIEALLVIPTFVNVESPAESVFKIVLPVTIRLSVKCPEPDTSNLTVGLCVPIPTLPLIITPSVGAVIVPAYVLPIATEPFTSKVFKGLLLPMPTLVGSGDPLK